MSKSNVWATAIPGIKASNKSSFLNPIFFVLVFSVFVLPANVRIKILTAKQNAFFFHGIEEYLSFLDADAGIDGRDLFGISQQGIDVHLLDLSGKTQKGREADDDFGILALVDALLPARTF